VISKPDDPTILDSSRSIISIGLIEEIKKETICLNYYNKALVLNAKTKSSAKSNILLALSSVTIVF
jgi:hypothetical protein